MFVTKLFVYLSITASHGIDGCYCKYVPTVNCTMYILQYFYCMVKVLYYSDSVLSTTHNYFKDVRSTVHILRICIVTINSILFRIVQILVENN